MHFFEEAERLFALEAGRVSLPTVEALLLIYINQVCVGLDGPEKMRIAVEYDMYKRLGLGKKQRTPKSVGDNETFRRELKARSVAAWGLFCYDVCVSS